MAALPAPSQAASPALFQEVSTGIALIKTFGCGGRPLGQGTGFLVGDSVVMTARHVVKGACKVSVRVNGESFHSPRWVYWHGGTASTGAADLATLKLDHAAVGAHIFRIRSSKPPAGTNLAMAGYPLGNRLSLNQGKIIWRGKVRGAPLLAVRMLGAEGASGAPFIDDAGRVVGILQVGLGSKDVLGQHTAGVVEGLDLARWWGPRARLDLCRSYPKGGIAGCQPTTPPSRADLLITTQALPQGQVGQPYSLQLTASGGSGRSRHWEADECYECPGSEGESYRYTLLSAGLHLSPTGRISGTPTEAGQYDFSVAVTDDQNYGAVRYLRLIVTG